MAKYKWPARKDIEEFLKKVEAEDEFGSLAFNESTATPLDRFRWEICQQILMYMQIHDMTQRALAQTLSVDEAEMSRILHHRIDKVSTDKLAGMIQKLNPNVKLSVG